MHLMTVKEAAARLRVSPSLVYGLIGKGLVRYVRIGLGRGRIRISDDDLAAFVAECRCHGQEPEHDSMRARPRRQITLHHLRDERDSSTYEAGS